MTLSGSGHPLEGIHHETHVSGNHSPTIKISPINATDTLTVDVQLFGHTFSFLVDTGAAVSLIQASTWKRCVPDSQILEPSTQRLVSVTGAPLQVAGTTTIVLNVQGMSFEAKVLIVEGLTTDGILGLDFLQFHKCSINIHKRCLYFSGLRVQIPLSSPISCSTGDVSISAIAAITTSIPAHCEQDILVGTNSAVDGTWLMEHNLQSCNCSGLQVARSLVQGGDTYIVCFRPQFE